MRRNTYSESSLMKVLTLDDYIISHKPLSFKFPQSSNIHPLIRYRCFIIFFLKNHLLATSDLETYQPPSRYIWLHIMLTLVTDNNFK